MKFSFSGWFDRSRMIYVRDLLRELVSRDIKLRYKRSVLGILWAQINPLAQMVVFTFLSRSVLRLDIPNYPVFVFSGLLAWNWFQNSLYLAADSITGNRELIRRPGFPVAVLPAVTVATNMVHYLLALPVLLLFLLVSQTGVSSTLLLLPLIMLIQFGLTLGLAYLIATIQVTFRDTQHLLSLGLLLLFYITPIFYSINNAPEQYRRWFYWNPMALLINAYREVALFGRWPDPLSLVILAGIALVLSIIGYRVFTNTSYRFAEEL